MTIQTNLRTLADAMRSAASALDVDGDFDDPWGAVAARRAITMPVGAVVITTDDNPQDIIDANDPGTTYWFEAGTYELTEEIQPQDGDELWTNSAILDGGAAYTVGDQFTDNSTVTGIEYGIDIKQGTGDNGVAEDVVVRGFEIRNCAKQGIRAWVGSDIALCFVHDCYQNGIGAGFANIDNSGYQFTMQQCVIWDCGSIDELGSGGGGTKLARTGNGTDVKQGGVATPADPDSGAHITQTLWYRNIGNGYWADVTSGGDLIEDCIAEENTRKGFFILEVSVGPTTIQDCTAKNNATWLYESPRTSSDYGITTETSLGVTIQRNRLQGNGDNNGIRVGEQGNRIAEYGHGTDDITVLDNNLLDSDALVIDPDASNVTDSGNTNQGAGVRGATWDGAWDPDILTASGGGQEADDLNAYAAIVDQTADQIDLQTEWIKRLVAQADLITPPEVVLLLSSTSTLTLDGEREVPEPLEGVVLLTAEGELVIVSGSASSPSNVIHLDEPAHSRLGYLRRHYKMIGA